MFQRKIITISDECMKWLSKLDSIEVSPEEAISVFNDKCAQIQEDIAHKITTVSEEKKSSDNKIEVVVEVRLARARKLNISLVTINTYAVVYVKNKKKHYITLDENKLPKKVSEIDNDMFISNNGGEFFEQLKTIKSEYYKILM